MHRTLAKVMVSQELFKDNTNHQSPITNHQSCLMHPFCIGLIFVPGPGQLDSKRQPPRVALMRPSFAAPLRAAFNAA